MPNPLLSPESMESPGNLTRTHSEVTAEERSSLLGQRGVILWLTGLSGSGKSTLAYALERKLVGMGQLSYVLDGDNIRMGLCRDLSFGPEDRGENIRRVGEVASLFVRAGVIVISSFISPYQADRDQAREKTPPGSFIEVYLDVPVSVCEERDPKGLYKRARAGAIPNFTGVSAPYEAPLSPELRLDTHAMSIDACVDRVVDYLRGAGVLRKKQHELKPS